MCHKATLVFVLSNAARIEMISPAPCIPMVEGFVEAAASGDVTSPKNAPLETSPKLGEWSEEIIKFSNFPRAVEDHETT